MAQMRALVLNPSVINTLWTNSVDVGDLVNDIYGGKKIPITPENEDDYGPTISIFSKISRYTSKLSSVCDNSTVITLEQWRIIYDALNLYKDELSDTYTLPSTVSTNPEATVTVSAAPPVFREINTELDYDNIVLTSLVNYAPAKIGTKSSTVVNRIAVCTRYQLNGAKITISNLILDQSSCHLLGALHQTPIVFSGESGAQGHVTGIQVVDSAAAVAVLGGDDLIYRSFGTTNVNGLLIDNITFTYTNDDTPPMMQHTIAVFGRSTGVPVVASCKGTPNDPDTKMLPTCMLENTKDETIGKCSLAGECLTEQGCCGRQMHDLVLDLDCAYGFRCPFVTKRNQPSMPNSGVLCNAVRCGCSTRYFTGSTCTALHGEYCATEAENCFMTCNDNVQIPSVHQHWQYNQSKDGNWYKVQPIGSLSEVIGVGYGQLVWTVRPKSGVLNYTTPDDLQVEAHFLPITGTEPGLSPFALITIVPDTDSATGAINNPNVKLRLNTEWFFTRLDQSQLTFSNQFLRSLTSTEWCVGANTSNGNLIELGRCGSAYFLDDWYFDGISQRLHVAGNPFLCPTFNFSVLTDAHLSDSFSLVGDKLVLAPCVPCAIGSERLLLTTADPLKTQLVKFNSTHYWSATLASAPRSLTCTPTMRALSRT